MNLAADNEALRRALRASEQKLIALSDSYPIGVYHCDETGGRTYTNASWQQIFDLPRERALGHAWLSAVHPEDRAEVTHVWQAAVAAARGFDMEFRIVRRDGAVRFVRSRARPVIEGSAAGGFVGALEDITERRENVERLRSSEAFLDRTGRLAGVGGWQVDLLSGSVKWSETTCAIHEVGADYSPTVDDAIAFYKPEAQDVIRAAMQDALRSGKAWDLELPFVSAKGRELWVRAFGEAEYVDGSPVRLVGAFQDISENRKRQKEFERERALRLNSEEHARDLDRLLAERDEMLDVLAHEIRQPLNNASAALQSAEPTLREAGEARALERVSRAQSVLAQVLSSIDNILAVASLLARAGPIDQIDTDIDTMITVAITDLPAGDRLRVRIERLTPTRTASMDMNLMRLAMRNLLSNALKYSPPGTEVVVRVSDSDEPLALVIDVADAGNAIPTEVLPNLFDRGVRGSHAGSAQGHGLGLYIVRRVIELHQGRTEVVRNEAAGVTFRVWLNQSPS